MDNKYFSLVCEKWRGENEEVESTFLTLWERLSLSLQDKWDEMRSLNVYIIRSLSLVTTTMHKEWMLDYWKRLKRQIMIKDNNLSTCHAAGHDSHTQTTLHIPHVAHKLVDRKSSFDHSLTKLKYFLPYTILPKKHIKMREKKKKIHKAL